MALELRDQFCRHDRGTQGAVVHLASETLREYIVTEQIWGSAHAAA